MKPNKTHYEAIDDFVHNTRSCHVSPRELIERFVELQKLHKQLPMKDLVKRGWFQTPDLTSLALVFFGKPVAQTSTLFRKSASAAQSLLTLWLAQARVKAEYACATNIPRSFTSLNKSQLREIAGLSIDPMIVKILPAKLGDMGIILVYLPALSGMKADGAVFKLSSGHPVVALSLRFPRLDYFWFTLMHELAHIVLHADKLDQPIFVDVETEEEAVAEKAANKLAKDSFVERSSWRNCEPKYQSGNEVVVKYAQEQGVHPSIIAGLLRRESGNYARYAGIINEHNVRKILSFHD